MFLLESCKLDMGFPSNLKTFGWQLSADFFFLLSFGAPRLRLIMVLVNIRLADVVGDC
jgi:hypothetical protein